MKATSLLNISTDSVKYIIKNYKAFLILSIVPMVLLTIISSFKFYFTSTVSHLVATLVVSILILPFSIKWTQKSLNSKASATYNDVIFWNPLVTAYLAKSITIFVLGLITMLPAVVLYTVSMTTVKPASAFIAVVAILCGLWALTFIARMGLILPALVDGKTLGINQCLEKTKDTSTALLLSILVFFITLAFISILHIFINIFLVKLLPAENFMTHFILMIPSNIFSLALSAIQITYIVKLYKKLKV